MGAIAQENQQRYGCEQKAKASPQTIVLPAVVESDRFELRTQAQVLRVNLGKDRRQATIVTYVNVAGEGVN